MNRYIIFQSLILFSFFLIFTSGRRLYYDELNDDSITRVSKTDEEDSESFQAALADLLGDDNNDGDDQKENASFDSYEEKLFHQRSVFPSFRGSTTISPDMRQAIMEMFQKAIDQGWKPNLKYHAPGTRFGRHRR
ncbi:unnamed protein product [Rotaria magnacalcarata]|uniref:Uncharacterized protein n=1 Tax=Rotaria magnacalcarata TaxID=392030 RepID=A0A816R272_9BILA|nr:unnamed protein product [Rotaria magnacalcarata]CAF2069364.1 unnamed protein product [Rotaria magnacalcarata]CAF2257819.1 unnamed protein product [Rotaria magnacalcarata]CAF3804361.1 unnamed protein product [Rotaria magnacalcarata]CAF4040857.1 unnamed protein product [Rotaria magnacalcarata]